MSTALRRNVSILSLVLASASASAAEVEDLNARLARLERENAAMRMENAALRENKRLREENGRLRSAENSEPMRSASSNGAAGSGRLAADRSAAPASLRAGLEARDPYQSYASADGPGAYKAPARPASGVLKIWGEGGAIWSGGDRFFQDAGTALAAFPNTTVSPPLDLTPKVGWEAATGFDYLIAGSPWHVSGQLRYGQSGQASAQILSSGRLDLGRGRVITASDTFDATYQESRWLADIAIGRDVFGTGPGALQVKGGLRLLDFETRATNSDLLRQNASIVDVGNVVFTNVDAAQANDGANRNSFLGAGPRVGVEGSIPFAGRWSLDYLSDVAVLFGVQRNVVNSRSQSSASVPVLAQPGTSFTVSTERNTALFNADLQFGLSYWINENVKLGGSYRVDALINTQDTTFTPNRFTHGPRLTVTGQFDAR
ncbi:MULTISPECIES: hypothetical protein [Bradyrhizobium]|uniref:Porin n=1 Tax=Bradyrhizobium denitrificans TaxID=2734912 RepID=A0ABS5GEU5_9BRAD|nr:MULTISPECIES: hypothetical protein [Bradyrhizobium]MBR1139111.1 hypothetical protein [Bradyrhizobium denitrificans]MDU0955785.1 hypothetical protein [Bradyrhizobium sp.]MDU1496057.1 hypothetical protein [Bradyrhizobium sp.]MDU1546208.1 hypothetical protein [Bradyrhizobium sp.]MDU1688807.1 hypothetical protein [Bradyrhizobium sp.]